MTAPLTPLVLESLDSLVPGPRPYGEVMDAWRTSCLTLPVWETPTSVDVCVKWRAPSRECMVGVIPRGRRFLHAHRGLVESPDVP